MGQQPVLTVSGLGKKYCPQIRQSLRYGVADILGEVFLRTGHDNLRSGEFWALEDINFDLYPGQSIGIVGGNGAGKSTLLKLLYGLLKPDRGEIRLNGRAEAIIELGTGFNPVLSARENVEMASAVYGFSSKRTRALIDEVLDFSQLGEFADVAIQNFSSGMKARLGFALASHLEPDILLVDEALAVGDLQFQRKAVERIHGYLASGGSVVLVSHQYYQIQSVCQRGLWLEEGRQMLLGSAVDVLDAMYKKASAGGTKAAASSYSAGPIRIDQVSVTPVSGTALRQGTPMRVTMRYVADSDCRMIWGFNIWTHDRWVCLAGEQCPEPLTIEKGAGELTGLLLDPPFSAGTYLLSCALLDPETKAPFDLLGYHSAAQSFEVLGPEQDLDRRAVNQVLVLDVDWSVGA
jgi:ABC-type polysaccharide/polyol phosphate transport system ATPase subunit